MTAQVLLGVAAIVLALSGLWVWWSHRRIRQTMARLDAMLEAAIAGDFHEAHFDESQLSEVESRMAQYLGAGATSAAALKRQRDQLNGLVSDVSHQTKTPLANIILYTQLLEEQALSAQGEECVAAIKGQTVKLQSLIEALVKTSRLETGILALHPEVGDVGAMTVRACKQYRAKAKAKNIHLSWETAPVQAVFDAKWTEEALCNLIDNAIKYTPEGGRVKVAVAPYPLFCAVTVIDNGVGISENDLPKIFQRFYRVQSGGEGVGVGLTLARQIAEGQGGYIKVGSKAGQGSTFALYLPRETRYNRE